MATEVGAIYYSVDARTSALLKAEKDVDGSTKRMEKNFSKTDKAARGMGAGFDSAAGAGMRLRRIVTAVSSAMATRMIISYTDAWTRTQNQLRQVTETTNQLIATNQQLMRVANDSAVAFESTASFYASVARATRELNIEQSTLVEFVDLTSKSLRANGASAAGASALILQLSQSFNAGIIQGQEFNTIIDQAPLLLDALRASTGKSTAELKKMGGEGRLSVQQLIKSVSDYSDEINKKAATATNTFSDNLVVARNNIIQFVGTADSAQGVVGDLGDAAVYLSNNLDVVTTAATGLAAVIAGRYASAIGAGAIAHIALAAAALNQAGATRQAALASNDSAAASLRKAQASVVAAQSTIREIEADRAALAATLSSNQAQGTQLAIKRQLAAMDHALAQAKERLAIRQQAEAQTAAVATAAHRANAAALASTTLAARAATSAMAGLRAAFALLGGPAGVIFLAAWALYAFREQLGFVASDSTATQRSLERLGRSMRDMTGEQLGRTMQELGQRLIMTQSAIQNTENKIHEMVEAGDQEFGGRTIGQMRDQLANLRKDLEATTDALDLATQFRNGEESPAKPPPPPELPGSGDNEAKRLKNEFDSVKRELETQREQIEREYLRRNEVIRKATAEGSAEQADLLRRSGSQRTRELQELTDQLASINSEGIERINQQYDAQRQEIMEISEAGSAEQLEALERNNQARQRALAEARRSELQGLMSQTEEVDAEYEKQRRSILEHTRAGSAERQALMERAERSFVEAKMQAQNDDLANIAQHNQRVRDLEAEHYSLMLQQIGGFSEAAANKLAEIRQATANPMKTLTDNLQTAFVSLDETISSAFVRGMSNGDSFNNILKGIGQTVLGSLLQSFIKLGVQMAINAVTQQAAGSAMTAVAIGQAAAVQAAWAPAALSASIATMGGATITGAAAYSGALAANATVGQAIQGGFMSQIGPGRLNGGGVSRGTPYPVTENGKPEILTEGNRQYLLPGKGGHVTSNRDMKSAGQAPPVSVNIYGGDSNARVEQSTGNDGSQTISIWLADFMSDGRTFKAINHKLGTSTKAR
ncbi:tape measure protein [Vreelandella populi]|uniref:Tape measure protein N-terminal domain-containing protein n=1 Tax=Vreelandella populi TaxID=2498858 RepID=A0A3S0WPZ1_9GAMM|nr:tape measure protein [Halomonas populi]RUR48788.1 hypothetical protein ELY37_02760 [Halomonas populi]